MIIALRLKPHGTLGEKETAPKSSGPLSWRGSSLRTMGYGANVSLRDNR
jgi:hypothetical protein